jgi:transposase InsO family protein
VLTAPWTDPFFWFINPLIHACWGQRPAHSWPSSSERELCQELDKLFEQNRGCYGSPRITRALREKGPQGNCYDNAKAEAFFSTLKTECFPVSKVLGSKAGARSAIFEYIEVYYNNQRVTDKFISV